MLAALAAFSPAIALAGVNVNLDPALDVKEVIVRGVLLSDITNPSSDRKPAISTDTIKVVNNIVEVPTSMNGMANYIISVGPRQMINLYALPEDNLTVNVASPFAYTVKGTALMEGITQLQACLAPVDAEYQALVESGNLSRETVLPLAAKYEAAAMKFISDNPDTPAAAFAITELEGDNCIAAFDALSEAAKNSPLYPLAAAHVEQVKVKMAAEARLKAMQSGEVDAPAFTLEGLDGKPVSLADFKGKWVVIDFWGAWCKWCIKGFPELKKAYEKYAGKLEVIGIDNRDTPEAWRAAVERFKLPWVNVYNPSATADALLEAYCVQGFPTKAIISPEGKIVDITVGEDPSFFTRLDNFMSK